MLKFTRGAVPDEVRQVAEGSIRGEKKLFCHRLAKEIKSLKGSEAVQFPEEEIRKLFGSTKHSIVYLKQCLKSFGIKPVVGFQDGVMYAWGRGELNKSK